MATCTKLTCNLFMLRASSFAGSSRGGRENHHTTEFLLNAFYCKPRERYYAAIIKMEGGVLMQGCVDSQLRGVHKKDHT